MYLSDKLHYTLYAKLAPDQRMTPNLEPHAIRNLIKGGQNASNELHNQVTSFKERCIGMHYVEKTRIIKCIFSGKRAAARWVLWNMPFAGHFIQLQDSTKDKLKAEDGISNLPLDKQYTIHVSTVGTTATIEDIHECIAYGLRLNIKSITRPHHKAQILHDRQWKVVINHEGQPTILREITKIKWKEHLLTIHHIERNSSIPCVKCYGPEHLVHNCELKRSTDLEILENKRKMHLLIPTGTIKKKQTAPSHML